MVGDAYTEAQALEYEQAIDQLRSERYRYDRFIVVLKSEAAAEALSDEPIRDQACQLFQIA